MKKTLLSAAAIIVAGMSANAQSIVTGFPNAYGHIDGSQSTEVTANGVSLALDATQHVYSGEDTSLVPLVNTISPGVYGVSTGTGGDGRSFWNYDFAATTIAGFTYTLTVLNEANGLSASFNPTPIGVPDDNIIVNGLGIIFGNSESLDFTTGMPAFPGMIGYDANANGTYDVILSATSVTGATTTDSIKIIAGTGNAPDAASTMGLMSISMAALGLVSRRFRK